jgi:hypothetical protein
MNRLALVLLFVVTVGSAVFAYRQGETIAEQGTRIAALNAQEAVAAARPKPASLDIQAKCPEQAHKAFVQGGFKTSNGGDYQSHYSAKLKKCFLEVLQNTPQGTTIWSYRNVFDAFEGKLYASYMWHTEPDSKYWEVAPMHCEVTLSSGEKTLCHSDDEFSDLVKVYMKED